MKISLISSVIASLVSLAFADEPNNDFIVDFKGDDKLTIADIIESNPNFSELFEGLNFTGLIETLEGEGPFTLFAPTDAAVQKLRDFNPGTIETWTRYYPFDLTFDTVLLYHVFEGEAKSKDIVDGLILEMANEFNATLMLNPPMIEDANIILTDVKASNGVRSSCWSQYLLCFRILQIVDTHEPSFTLPQVIHVIDTVMIPPDEIVYPGLFYVLNATGDFGIFLDILETLNLTQSLFSSEDYTIFAPTDEAFLKLGNITDDEEVLLAIVGAHFVKGFYYIFDGVLPALSGNNLTISINNETGVMTVDDALIVLHDLFASNGIVNGIGTFYFQVTLVVELASCSHQ